MKDASAHFINREFVRKGGVWQRESFDRIIRRDENLRQKAEYIANYPVRADLADVPHNYPWLWRRWRVASAAEDGRRSTMPSAS